MIAAKDLAMVEDLVHAGADLDMVDHVSKRVVVSHVPMEDVVHY